MESDKGSWLNASHKVQEQDQGPFPHLVDPKANDTWFNIVQLLLINKCWTLLRLVDSLTCCGNLLNGIEPSSIFVQQLSTWEWCIILESDTGILGKKSACSYQESNLRPSDYEFGCSTTELPLSTCWTAYFNVQHHMIHRSTFLEQQLQHLLLNKCWTVYHWLNVDVSNEGVTSKTYIGYCTVKVNWFEIFQTKKTSFNHDVCMIL